MAGDEDTLTVVLTEHGTIGRSNFEKLKLAVAENLGPESPGNVSQKNLLEAYIGKGTVFLPVQESSLIMSLRCARSGS